VDAAKERLGGVLECEPPSSPPKPLCDATFPRPCVYVGTTPEDGKKLSEIIWLDGTSRGVTVPLLDDAHASELRCLRTGPDLSYNMRNWCCR
jgi:hypothetical protein